MMTNNKALDYAFSVVNKKVSAPKYVIIQCQEFIEIVNGQSPDCFFDEKLFGKFCKILRLLKMARGPKAGSSIYGALSGYQWLLIAALCVKLRSNPQIRRYKKMLLEVSRKNGKTFIIAVLFIVLFYTEPKFAKFFSVAPNGDLAKEIKDAIGPLISVNENAFSTNEWRVTRDYISHNPNDIMYRPLNFSTSNMDGKEPNVYIADEVGALPTNYPIEAMESGQIMVKNPLGFIISTKYPTFNNPFEDEVKNAKKILDGIKDDDSLFALLYEPDEVRNWENDDNVLAHSNPLAMEIPAVWDTLLKKRADAIDRESLRQNFLTKHCNIIYQGVETETYIDVRKVQECKVDMIDWEGRDVFLGVDLAMSGDNTSVSMVSLDNGKIYAHSIAFIPEGMIEKKCKVEKVDYYRYIKAGKCIACGDLTVDYSVIEDYVFGIEKMFGVTVKQIGFDRWNAMSSAQKWDEQYETVEIKQHSSVLHPATKLLYEKIVNQEFAYEENELLEINFQNARCTFDTNMNRYVNKKKSEGKVDMVVSLINAIHLANLDSMNNLGFVAMVL